MWLEAVILSPMIVEVAKVRHSHGPRKVSLPMNLEVVF